MKTKLLSLTALLAMPAVCAAVLPKTGRPVPELTAFDDAMEDFMETNAIEAGVLGIMRNGAVVYLRGFGSKDGVANMPENAIVRLASCTKPVTAAAIRRRIEDGEFTLDTKAFSFGANGGYLTVDAWGGYGSLFHGAISVRHLLAHAGGWDEALEPLGDLTYEERTVSQDMGLPGAPGRTNVMRWVAGKPLRFTPGTRSDYANEGYLTLGFMVAPNATAHLNYLRTRVWTPDMWVPGSEIMQCRTLLADCDPREPVYRTNDGSTFSVFDSSANSPIVSRAYGGGFSLEARLGQGGVAASAAAMLALANSYHVGVGGLTGTGAINGMPISAANPLTSSASHTGSYSGVNTAIWQMAIPIPGTGNTDRVAGFIAFARDSDVDFDSDGSTDNFAGEMKDQINGIISGLNAASWPAVTCDGYWVTLTSALPDTTLGGYSAPWRGFGNAIAKVQEHTRLRLRPGTTNWTGTISKRLRLDAPLGQVRLGFQ
jgi:hypothetical protein